MRKLYCTWLKTSNWVIAALLGSLGFQLSCEKGGGGGGMDMYGTPTADYSIKGKVTDQQDQPIPGIQVEVVSSLDSNFSQTMSDTIYTDESGAFKWDSRKYIGMNRFKVFSRDIDGKENGGEFQTDSTIVSFENIPLKDKDGWYRGWAEQNVDIKLKEKQEENNK